jgi:putative holliday junction resolvase
MSITSSKTASISHYLGVDFGKAKIGLAVADSETRIAISFGMLNNDKGLVNNLKNIIEKKGISRIVVGNAGEEVKDFAAMLEKKLGISAEFQNELFSTQQAERNLIEKGAKKIKRFDDQEAARIILQSWLDKKE